MRAGVLAALLLAAPIAGLGSDDVALQERQCIARGWTRAVMDIDGVSRKLLWKALAGAWPKGALLVLHGGGGRHFQWCVANVALTAPQVRFSERAVAEGFAVFLLDSSDRVTDNQGRRCGKVWDDEVRDRPNLDLPFIGAVIREFVPQVRPAKSAGAVFLTGLSSGGYMTVRAATHFGGLVSAFAPVSSGDPYGWHRVCDAGLTRRTAVHGAGFDNESGRRIDEPGACAADAYPNEQPWDSASTRSKPDFRMFRHDGDGIHDESCSRKASELLRRHGYPGQPDFVMRGEHRGLENHFWLDAYSGPILDFFAGQRKAPAKLVKSP